MKAGKAFLAGVVGGAVMSAIMLMAREVMGMNIKLELLVLLSLVHILIAGVFMGALLPPMHPLVPEMMPGPGYFMLNLGVIGLVALIMLHMIYGAIVGAMYGPVLHPHVEARRDAV